MYSDMSMRTIACSESNMNSASARASSVLPTPVGPMNRKRADRAVGVLQPGARAAQRVGHGLDGLVLADHALVQALLHVHELLPPRTPSACDTGMPVQRATTSATSSSSTSSLRKVRSDCSSRSLRLLLGDQLLELGDLAVAQLGRALEVGVALGALGVAVRLLQALLGAADGVDGLLLALPVRLHLVRRARAGRPARARSPRGARRWRRPSPS